MSHLRDIVRLPRPPPSPIWTAAPACWPSRRRPPTIHIAQGLDAARTHVCYNGVDLERFRPREGSGYLHHALGIDPGCRLLATIGQVGRRKGTDRFLEIAHCVAPTLSDVHWLVIGTRTSTKQEAIDFEVALHARAMPGSPACMAASTSWAHDPIYRGC